jgi:glycosyltransferase 2 family protein
VRRAWFVVRVLVAVGLLAFVLRRVDPGEAADRVASAPWWVFVAPSLLLFFNSGVHAVRILLLLPAPRPAFGPVLRSVLLGNFFGLFLPTGGGEAAKVVALGRTTGDFEAALAALAASRLLEMVPWGLLCLWGALGVLPDRLPELVALAWFTAAAFTGILVAVVVLRRFVDRVRLPAWVERRLGRVVRFDPPRSRVWACLLAAVPFALLNCLSVWCVARGYGVALSYPTIMGVIPTLDVLISLPVTISGVGVREAAYVHGFGAYGVDAPTALAIAFTRWTGELFRAGVGGVLFLAAPRHAGPRP